MIYNQDGFGFSGLIAPKPLGNDITKTAYNNWPLGISNLGNYTFVGGVFDGQSIWLMPHTADGVVKIDKNTGAMTGYNAWPSDLNRGTGGFSGGVSDVQNLWLIPCNASQVVKN